MSLNLSALHPSRLSRVASGFKALRTLAIAILGVTFALVEAASPAPAAGHPRTAATLTVRESPPSQGTGVGAPSAPAAGHPRTAATLTVQESPASQATGVGAPSAPAAGHPRTAATLTVRRRPPWQGTGVGAPSVPAVPPKGDPGHPASSAAPSAPAIAQTLEPTWQCWATGEVADPCREWLADVALVPPDTGWAAGRSLMRLVDGEWRLSPMPQAHDLALVELADDGSVWLAGHTAAGAGRLWRWAGDAEDWLRSPAIDEAIRFTAMDMLSASDGWLAGIAAGVSGLYRFDGESLHLTHTVGSAEIRAIDMVSTTLGWAVGGYNPAVILRYENGRWLEEAAPQAPELYGVAMLSADEGWAVGGINGQPWILHYHAGVWTRQETPWWGWLEDVQAWAPDDVWAVGAFGGVYHYDGRRWQQVPLSPYIYNLQSLSMRSPTDGWAVGSGGALVRFDGQKWQTTTPPDLTAMTTVPDSPLCPDEAWAVGHEGRILHFDGRAWQAVDSPTTATLRDVVAKSPYEAWAVGDGGTVLHLGEVGWTAVPVPTQAGLFGVDALASGETWVVGGAAGQGVSLWHSLGVWREVAVPTDEIVIDIALTGPGEGWAISNSGIYRLQDRGWHRVPNPATQPLSRISVAGDDVGWIVGENGTRLRLTADGWQPESPSAGRGGPAFYAVRVFPNGTGWAAGYFGALWRLADGRWTEKPTPTRSNIYGLTGTDAGHMWAAGEGGLILRLGEVRPGGPGPTSVLYVPWALSGYSVQPEP